MPLFTSARIGDTLVLTDTRTGTVSEVEIIDVNSTGKLRLAITAAKHINIKHEDAPVDDKPREPGPLGSSRVASAMQLADEAGAKAMDATVIGGEGVLA